MKKIVLVSSVMVIVFFLMSACCEKSIRCEPGDITVKPGELTFLYYADTRLGPFEPSSWNQKRHAKFIEKVMENEKNNGIKYLVFGGDNVWLGFCSSAWKKFFEVMGAYEECYKDIKIYPALGNHELILAEVLYKHLSGVEGVERRFRKLTTEAFIQKLEKGHESKEQPPIFKQIAEVYSDAQEESLDVLKNKKDKGLFDTPWKRFKKYVDAWPHLKDIVPEGKTYYSFKLPIGNTGKTAKFIVADSNRCDLDDAQKKWYENELNFTEGPVITVCHHPIFYPENETDLFRHWNAPPHLFLVGHEHDYERRSLDKEGNNPPIHIISGSGGAPLETGKKPYCDDEKTHQFKKWYNYCRVTIDAEKISIIVFGCKKIKDPFTQIEKLEFSW